VLPAFSAATRRAKSAFLFKGYGVNAFQW
jgi:hypothetical protein